MHRCRWILLTLPLLAACHRPWLETREPEPPGLGPAQASQTSPWGYAAAPAAEASGWQTVAGPVAPSGEGWQMPTTAAHKATSFARSQQGAAYCWGGVGPSCYDCSGLTFAAWWWAGKRIPRTSDEQHDELAPVPLDALQPGDILWRPGHVGLYVGDGWAIHSPGSGHTVEYQRADHYVAARRP